jgi:hypothetical protein
VAKLSPEGAALAYATYLGGRGSDFAPRGSVSLDGSGSAYVAGGTSSTDFPTTPGSLQPAFGGGPYDGFVAKLSPEGAALAYATYLGGSGDDFCEGIAVDDAGQAHVTGWTESTDFPTTPGALQPASGGSSDAFVAKLSPEGAALAYATYLGGTGYDGGHGITVDPDGRAYVTGATSSPDFPTTPGALQPAFGGGEYDAFVAKLSPEGAALAYSTYLGGSDKDEGYGVAHTPTLSDTVFVTGPTASTDVPVTPGALQENFNNKRDAFIAKLTT